MKLGFIKLGFAFAWLVNKLNGSRRCGGGIE
ncbi:UNVERIFIED_CONTAM: hypothetical protein ABIC26_004811 [Paenibacillus sp. PvR008]